jgi:hypothetical protein
VAEEAAVLESTRVTFPGKPPPAPPPYPAGAVLDAMPAVAPDRVAAEVSPDAAIRTGRIPAFMPPAKSRASAFPE